MKHFLCALVSATSVHAIDVGALVRTGLVLPDTLLQHQSELGISAEQADHLRKMADDARQEGRPLEEAVKQQQEAFDTALKNLETPSAAASEPLKALLDAEAALKQLQLRTLLKLRDELSPEQRKKALKLGKTDALTHDPLEARLKDKGMKVKTAFESLGIQLPESLKSKAAAIESQAREGRLSEAEKSLDLLIKETGVDEAAPATTVDFDKFEPGATEISTLQERYQAVTAKAGEVTHLPTLKLLVVGRDELEKAKAAEDATRVAKILTWAEGILNKKQ